MGKRCVVCDRAFDTVGVQCEACRVYPEAKAEDKYRMRRAFEAAVLALKAKRDKVE